MIDLRQTWLYLEGDDRSGEGRLQRRLVPSSHRSFFLGLELPSRSRMLIFRVSPESASNVTMPPESQGISISITRRDETIPVTEIELVLTNSEHADLFDLLIENLIESAEEPVEEAVAVTRFLGRLTEWQQFLSKLAAGSMSREMRQALWGELWTLREIVTPAMGFATSVRGWKGPMGSPQDFQFERCAVEVKTSVSNTFQAITITNERQLDVCSNSKLYLVALSLDDSLTSGQTLPELVKDLRELAIDNGCLHILNAALVLYGYNNDHAESYSDIKYSVRKSYFFSIHDDFPRIIGRDLKLGIRDVSYTVDMVACDRFSVDRSSLIRSLEGDVI